MSNLPSPFGGPDLSRIGGYSRPPRDIARDTSRAVGIVQGQGIVQHTKVQVTEYVAHGALMAVQSLTALEAAAAAQYPHGAARYQAIVDTAAVRLAQIVAETGRG